MTHILVSRICVNEEVPVLRSKPKLNLGLTAYEELFMNDKQLTETRLAKIFEIPINLIDDFPDHPFRVKSDEDMDQLVVSIKEQGLITPVTLRPKDNGRYEMVSGHRRKEACIRAGLTTIKADVREMTQDEAIVLMGESNLQRSVILPSEKAFAYKMRLEALKRQGKKGETTCGQVVHKSRDIISEESGRQVSRYIRLTHLIPDLLNLVDEGRIALSPAVELSYVTQGLQEIIYEQIIACDCTPSHAQTRRIRQLSKEGRLTAKVIEAIMREEKPNQKEKIHIPYDQIREFLPKGQSYKETCCYIRQALEFYQKNQNC